MGNADATCSVIDTANNIVIATVSLGGIVGGVAVTPDGTKVYVTDLSNSNVPVIDISTNAVIATVPVGGDPFSLGQFIGSIPGKSIPTITWSNPADIVYGTPLSSTQLNAVASVPGTYVYTPAAGTILNVGTQTLHVDFTPTDTVNYTTASKDVTINVTAPLIPVANFSATPTSGTVPLNVSFTDTTVGAPTSWKWDFGDGKSSTIQNPSHIYQSSGTYNVSLTVKNKNGTNTTTKTNYITVTNPPLVANFSATSTSGTAPLTVSFTDTTVGTPTSWKWDFGDKGTSTKRNPTEIYKKPGTYTVSLTVKDGFGTNTTTKTGYITVS